MRRLRYRVLRVIVWRELRFKAPLAFFLLVVIIIVLLGFR
jgi:hypothetical protein